MIQKQILQNIKALKLRLNGIVKTEINNENAINIMKFKLYTYAFKPCIKL